MLRLSALALLPLLALSAQQLHAQTTVPFSRAGKDPAACSLEAKLPRGTIVVAAGNYSGRRLAFQIDQSGHEATQFDVAVHSDKPIALLLGAYEPTIWSIGWTKGTKIVAVFATGYHRQVVAGLPSGTPVIVSSLAEKGACGGQYLSGGGDLAWVNPKAREVFGRDAARVYLKAPDGVLEINESNQAKSAYVTSPDTPPESFKDKTGPAAGTAGLEQAVAAGQLRPLTQADIQVVRDSYRALAPKTAKGTPDVPPVAGAAPKAPPEVRIPALGIHRGYVVLKPMVYPAGLFGANLAYFVIPNGAPAPTGNPGHSTVIDLNKAVPCSGALCN